MIKTEVRRFMHLSLLVSVLILLALLSQVYDYETIEQRYVSQKIIKSFFSEDDLSCESYISENLYKNGQNKSRAVSLKSGDMISVKFDKASFFMIKDEPHISYSYNVNFSQVQYEYLIVFKQGDNKISKLYINGESLDTLNKNVSDLPYSKKNALEKATKKILKKYNDSEFIEIFNNSSESLKQNGTRDQFVEYLENVKYNYGVLNDIEITENRYDMGAQTYKICGTTYSSKIQDSVSIVVWIKGSSGEKLSGIKFYDGKW